MNTENIEEKSWSEKIWLKIDGIERFTNPANLMILVWPYLLVIGFLLGFGPWMLLEYLHQLLFDLFKLPFKKPESEKFVMSEKQRANLRKDITELSDVQKAAIELSFEETLDKE